MDLLKLDFQNCSMHLSTFAKQNQAEVWPRFQSFLKLLLWTKGVEWIEVLNALGPLCLWQCFYLKTIMAIMATPLDQEHIAHALWISGFWKVAILAGLWGPWRLGGGGREKWLDFYEKNYEVLPKSSLRMNVKKLLRKSYGALFSLSFFTNVGLIEFVQSEGDKIKCERDQPQRGQNIKTTINAIAKKEKIRKTK